MCLQKRKGANSGGAGKMFLRKTEIVRKPEKTYEKDLQAEMLKNKSAILYP